MQPLWKWATTLFLLAVVTAKAEDRSHPNEIKPEGGTLSKGVLFIRQGGLHVNSNRVIVPVSFRYNGLLEHYSMLLTSLGKVKTIMKQANITEQSYHQEVDILQKSLHETSSRVQRFFYSYQIVSFNLLVT